MAEIDKTDGIGEVEAQTAPQYGKFNTAEELLFAYNALESEFTKRCQLIKQLQAELSQLRAQASAHDQAANAGECAQPDSAADTEGVIASEAIDNAHEKPTVEGEPHAWDNEPCASSAQSIPVVLDEILLCAAEYADVLSGIPEIMSACITRYKQKLIETRGSGSPAGMAVIMPAKRPRTLADAKRLADEMLGR